MRIAILGATSQVAKNLIVQFCEDAEVELFLFARDIAGLQTFLASMQSKNGPVVNGYERFADRSYDAILNCVGIADPIKQRNAGIENFLVTEKYDNLALEYLEGYRETIYVFFSSGAVYGNSFKDGVDESDESRVRINDLGSKDAYRIAKINAEAKHRAFLGASIIDIRLFSFFSRFVDLRAGFLLSEMVRSIKQGAVFTTNRSDLVRDYIAPSDLFRLVRSCLARPGINDVVDAYSAAPVSKSELIKSFSDRYQLVVEFDEQASVSSSNGRNMYFSRNQRANKLLGYAPKVTSLKAVLDETDLLVGAR